MFFLLSAVILPKDQNYDNTPEGSLTQPRKSVGQKVPTQQT
jgi:hypothetical protein